MRIKNLTIPEEVHYCKQQLKDGKPIKVKNLDTGKEYSTDAWRRIIYDEDGNPWIDEIVYEPDKKDKSGARVKLETRRM